MKCKTNQRATNSERALAFKSFVLASFTFQPHVVKLFAFSMALVAGFMAGVLDRPAIAADELVAGETASASGATDAALSAADSPPLANAGEIKVAHVVAAEGKPTRCESDLAARFRVAKEDVRISPTTGIPYLIRDTGRPLWQEISNQPIIREEKVYDLITIGGGPGGLVASLYQGEAGANVKIIERNPFLGSLATGSYMSHIGAAAGAAYASGPHNLKQYRIYQHLGFGAYKKLLTIHDPVDSFLWEGVLYKDVWEDETLVHLPASFALFKHALTMDDNEDLFDPHGNVGRTIDLLDMATFVRSMPFRVSQRKDAKSKAIYRHFIEDSRVDRRAPMEDVIRFLDLFGRSALGSTTDKVSARQFSDFYTSEFGMRYTWMHGTGFVTNAIVKKFTKLSNVTVSTSSTVLSVEDKSEGVTVIYQKGGQLFECMAKRAVFAAPITLAPRVIKNFSAMAPDKAAAIAKIQMTNYLVHVVHVKGHPFRETYDLWLGPKDSDPRDPTDIVLGRWMDPKVLGFDGMQDFETHPEDDYGVLTIYHPQGVSTMGRGITEADALQAAEFAVRRMTETLEKYVQERGGKKFEIELVETYPWPDSIHIVHPGYLQTAHTLKRPFGHIAFANNTLQSPDLESALELGFDAHQELKAMATP